MEAISGSSIVAVLSTSELLLPASTKNTSAPAALRFSGGQIPGNVWNKVSSEEASDIFVAYERMKSSASVLNSSLALNRSDPSFVSPVRESATFGHRDEGRHGNTGAYGAQYDKYGHHCHRDNVGSQQGGLLVTTSPSRLTTKRQRDNGDGVTASSPSRDRDKNAPSIETRGRYDQGRHNEAQARPPAMTLCNAAPIPLLVFDTETFLAMGELDERFTFQGGIAEWISRVEFDGCRAPGTMRAVAGHGTSTGSSCSDFAVQHFYEREWGRRFVRSWPDDHESTEDVVQSRGPAARQRMPDARSSRLDWRGGDGPPWDESGERERLRGGGDRDTSNQSTGLGDLDTSKVVTIDKWNQLRPEELEVLVQRDADLFFLPLLLSRQSSGEIPRAYTHENRSWVLH